MSNTEAAEARVMRVKSMTHESDGVLSARFECPRGNPLPDWSPGAHIDVLLPNGVERQYSLCGDPSDGSSWRIGVLREPSSGGGSEFIHTRMRPGDEVRVRGPRNNFALKECSRFVFVAGGVGITPLLPMIAEVDSKGADWSLVYGGRVRSSMAFLDELERYGDRVTVWPQDERGLIDLASTVVRTEGCGVYCCGPEPLIAALERHCAEWPSGSLRLERFAAKPVDATADDASFEAILTTSGTRVIVEPGTTIVEALEAEGIYPPVSCSEGVCGTCETKVLAGVPDHRDSVLTTDEQAVGDVMMICVSRSKTSRLELDL